jgi:hypothetical protein
LRTTRLIFAAALAALAVRLLFADGGTLQLQEQSQGLLISLFSSPSPLRAGSADLSVMVQNAKDHTTVLNASVLIRVSILQNEEVRETAVPATHVKATNKLLYAAQAPFSSAGDWKVAVDVTENGRTTTVSGLLRVLPPRSPVLAYWPFFLAIPIIIALFAVNQRLRRKRGLRNPRVLP